MLYIAIIYATNPKITNSKNTTLQRHKKNSTFNTRVSSSANKPMRVHTIDSNHNKASVFLYQFRFIVLKKKIHKIHTLRETTIRKFSF